MPKVSIIIPVYNVENFIYDMLMSVKNQTFKDYEVILVNDGSKDNSQAVIDAFCEKDNRFKCIVQENRGVAAARNNGLSKACGEYVVFYDPDDYIPSRALEKLYDSVKAKNAEIGIGVMRESSIGESRYNASTIRIGKKKLVSRYDKNLLWSFSVCNKIFKRSLLVENDIKFPKFKHAEDAVFLFTCIFAADVITGCPTCVYEYKLRPFWEGKSATQIISYAYLKDVIDALDCIEDIILSAEAGGAEKQAFLDEFYTRYLDVSLFVGYYRFLWSCDEICIELLKNKTAELRAKISQESWDKIVKKNRDLILEKGIFNKREAMENALLTFVIKDDMSDEEFFRAINSIYRQAMPLFVVLADQRYSNLLEENGIKYENIILKDKPSAYDVRTEYVAFVEPDIVYSRNSIKTMLNALLADEANDFASVPLRLLKGNRFESTSQNAAFCVMQTMKNNPSAYNDLDFFKGNKLMKKSLAESVWDEERFPYGDHRFKKLINVNMVMMPDSRRLEESCRGGFRAKIKGKQVQVEHSFISLIKKHFTKEDVKKVFKKI